MKRVLVFGATGYTGREVVRVLIERGVTTHAHIRGNTPRLRDRLEEFTSIGAQPEATPWEEKAIRELLNRVQPTVVFALLGTTAKRARQAKEEDASYEAIDYGLTAMAIRASLDCGSRPRFVFLSSMGAGGKPKSAYLRARWKVEHELTHSGLPYTIARPSIITGPNRKESRPLEHIASVISDAFLHAIGSLGAKTLRNRYRSTTATRLAHGLIYFASRQEGENRVVLSDELYKIGVSTEEA